LQNSLFKRKSAHAASNQVKPIPAGPYLRMANSLFGVSKVACMKKRHVAVFATILLLGGLFGFIRPSRVVGSSVTLALVTNSQNQSSSGVVFQITNGDERAILMTDLIVETNSVVGWQACSHSIPTHPQRLATGDTKDLLITPPDGEKPWRLRITYGKDVKGPMLLVGKVGYAVSQCALPGQGFGIMAGSNSCVSGEMKR
jgi:hypothetical protein